MATDAEEYRCFIGGLSWNTTDRDLEDAFRPYGDILEAKVVINRETGRSKGFGFVTYREEQEMQEAIDKMHGMTLDGRSITVDKAGKATFGGGYGGGGGGGGGSNQDCFKCGKPGHWARECPSSGGGRRFSDSYGNGHGDRGGRDGDRDIYAGSIGSGSRYGGERNDDRYGGRSRYASERNSDRYGGRPSRDSDARDRYPSGGPSRGDGGNYRDRAGPYDREAGNKYGGGGGSSRNDVRSTRGTYSEHDY